MVLLVIYKSRSNVSEPPETLCENIFSVLKNIVTNKFVVLANSLHIHGAEVK